MMVEAVAGAPPSVRAAQDRPDSVLWSSAKKGPLVALPRVPPSELEEKFRKSKAFKYGRRKLVFKGGLRKPVLELVERPGPTPPDAEPPPSRPARSSGRHGRTRNSGQQRSFDQQRSADQLPQKKTPPPRPPPPNLQAALGSPPSYEETLQMDTAAAGRLSASSSSGNPFLIGSSHTVDLLLTTPGAPLHRDHSAPALTSGGSSANSAAGASDAARSENASRRSSTRSSVDSASRRSSATPSVDGAFGRSSAAPASECLSRVAGFSEPAAGGDPWSRRSSGVASVDLPSRSSSATPSAEGAPCDGGGPPPETTTQSSAGRSRASYNPFVASPAAEERSAVEGEVSPSVTAPPRHPRAVSVSVPTTTTPTCVPTVIRPAPSSAARDSPGGGGGAGGGGGVGRPGKGSPPAGVWAASSLSTARSDSGWSGRVSRGATEQSHVSPFSRDGRGRTAQHGGGGAFGRDTVWSGRVSSSTAGGKATVASAGMATSASTGSLSRTAEPPATGTSGGTSGGASRSASPSVSHSTSPANSLPASPPASPPNSRPPTSCPDSLTYSPSSVPSSSPSGSPLVLTVHTTVSHDSARHSAGAESAVSTSPTVSFSSARSSIASLDRADTSSLPNGGTDVDGSAAVRCCSPGDLSGSSAEATLQIGHGAATAAAAAGRTSDADAAAAGRTSDADAPSDSGGAAPLDWGLPIGKVSADTPQAVALYDFHSSAPGDLNFKSGDTLVLLRRVTADWLLCRLRTRHGLVPAHHVRETVPLSGSAASPLSGSAASPLSGSAASPLSGSASSPLPSLSLSAGQLTSPASPDSQPASPDSQPASQPTSPDGQRAMALYDFVAQEKHDLGFQAGDMLMVLGKLNDDWGYGSRRGVSGQFPLAYVDVAVEAVPAL